MEKKQVIKYKLKKETTDTNAFVCHFYEINRIRASLFRVRHPNY